MTRRVLIVCYYFPPLGLAGVGRPLNLFKYLPSRGWDTHILTVKPVAYRAYEPELLAGLDLDKIHRSGSYDPQRLMYLAGWRKISSKSLESGYQVRNRFFPDSKRGWIGPAVRLGKKLVEEFKYDLLLSTAPPISAHLVALKLHESSGIKWVADFRDYWTSRTIEDSYSDARMIARAREVMSQIAASSAAIAAVNGSVGGYVGATHVITNGFDSATASLWKSPETSKEFRIGLLGTFSSWNPVEPLFKVIDRVRKNSPDKFNRIALVQVGNVQTDQFLAMANQYGMRDRCRLHGLKPRVETVGLLQGCSCFYQALQPGWGKGITSARIFDLLASGRPILAYTDWGGEVEKLVRSTGNGFCFSDETLEQAAQYLLGLLAAQEDNKLKIEPVPPYAEPYRWERIAGQFADLFGSLV